MRALADALGVAGDPVHQDGYWHLQTDDAVLEVYEGGGGSWWYSIQQYEILPAEGGGSAGCEPGPAVDCGVAAPPDAASSPDHRRQRRASHHDRRAGNATSCTGLRGSRTAPPARSAPARTGLPARRRLPGAAAHADRAPAAGRPPVRGRRPQDRARPARADRHGRRRRHGHRRRPVRRLVRLGGAEARRRAGQRTGCRRSRSARRAPSPTRPARSPAPERVGDYPLIDTRAAIDRLNETAGRLVRLRRRPPARCARHRQLPPRCRHRRRDPPIDLGAPTTTIAECATSPTARSCSRREPGASTSASTRPRRARAGVETRACATARLLRDGRAASAATTRATTLVEPCGPLPRARADRDRAQRRRAGARAAARLRRERRLLPVDRLPLQRRRRRHRRDRRRGRREPRPHHRHRSRSRRRRSRRSRPPTPPCSSPARPRRSASATTSTCT